MPAKFHSHPCNNCLTADSVQGHYGFCSRKCRYPNGEPEPKASAASAAATARTAPTPAGPRAARKRKPKSGQPLGSNCYALFWFSITIGMAGTDIPMEAFDLIMRWLDAFCVRGLYATERGKKDRLLHLQGACEIRAPPKEDKGHLMVSATLREYLKIKPGGGWKIMVKYFAAKQTPALMIGYCLKDWKQAWFNVACKGISEKDMAKARHDYMIKKQSYAAGKDLLEKKAFMYTVFKFYGSYLLPLPLNVAQVVRLFIP